ncbi:MULTISPECIES: hypothetical protein [Vibrio harveyi group]|nr:MULTISPECIES: hypothetical protein [Vibrio harveyi group]MDG2838937.1 hypothetical protein [Vibrio parahaemolyticus]
MESKETYYFTGKALVKLIMGQNQLSANINPEFGTIYQTLERPN